MAFCNSQRLRDDFHTDACIPQTLPTMLTLIAFLPTSLQHALHHAHEQQSQEHASLLGTAASAVVASGGDGSGGHGNTWCVLECSACVCGLLTSQPNYTLCECMLRHPEPKFTLSQSCGMVQVPRPAYPAAHGSCAGQHGCARGRDGPCLVPSPARCSSCPSPQPIQRPWGSWRAWG